MDTHSNRRGREGREERTGGPFAKFMAHSLLMEESREPYCPVTITAPLILQGQHSKQGEAVATWATTT